MTTKRNITRVYLSITALNWFAVALPLPIFVLFMQSRGLSLSQIGIVMGLYSATIVLLELPTGGLADAVGRKPVALLAHTINLVSGLFLFLAFSFWSFLAGMILMGVARALNSGALDAWFVDRLQEDDPAIDLQPPLAQAGTITLLALGLGTLAGGFLPTLFQGLPAEGTALLTPLSTTLLLSLALRLLLLILIGLSVEEPPHGPTDASGWRKGFAAVPHVIGEALTLSRHNNILPALMGATVVGGFSLAAVETFWQPRFALLLDAGSTQSWVFGLLMATSFAMGMAGNMLATPLSRRLHHRYGILAGLARGVQSLALMAMALSRQIIPAGGGFWLFYLSSGTMNSPHETLVNQEIPPARRSSMLSLQSLAFYIGSFGGSVLIGFIADRRSIGDAWLLAALLSALSLGFYVYVSREKDGQTIPLRPTSQEADAG
jgi:MFS family permease